MYAGYVESEAVVKVRWEAMQKRAEMLLKYRLEALHTEVVLARVRSNRLAREAKTEIKEGVK